MLKNPKSELIAVAAFSFALGFGADILSRFLYWHLLVPRLPRFHSVPFWWWLLVFSPVILVFLILPFFSSRWWFVSANAGLGVIAALFFGDWQNYQRGLPVSHDTFFGSAEHMSLFATQAAAILIVAIATGWSSAFTRRRIKRRMAAAY
jgi:hypothetical protein